MTDSGGRVGEDQAHAPRGRLRWRVFCEVCEWRRDLCESRDHAVRFGNSHAQRCTDEDGQYRFRVQGIHVGSRQPNRRVQVGRKSFPPHLWEAHPTSRDKSQPCGRCGIYRYLHDEIYEVVAL